MCEWACLSPLRVSHVSFSIIPTHDRLNRIAPSPLLLAYHFFYVAFYSIWVLFTHPRPISPDTSASGGEKPVYAVATIEQYPLLALKSVFVVCTFAIFRHRVLGLTPRLVLEGMRRVWSPTMV